MVDLEWVEALDFGFENVKVVLSRVPNVNGSKIYLQIWKCKKKRQKVEG
jgi:hypothetical protein